MTLRVGAVAYLNTKPLLDQLPQLAPALDLVLDLPSRLADALARGALDIALIPSIEYFRADNYTILPGSCIASVGPVMSVKLCSRVAFADLRTVGLDEGSRTSVALMDILLHHLFGVAPRGVALPIDADPRQIDADGGLLIGDRAMRVLDGEFPFTLDLGYEWSRWTGLPFVWAFWAVAQGVIVSAEVQQAFEEAKRRGRRRLAEIAAREADLLGLDETRCRYYLEHVIRHDFGRREFAGLRRFQELAVERGLIPAGVECVFHDRAHPVESR